MSAQHTPGDWFINETPTSTEIRQAELGGKLICEFRYGLDTDEDVSNARLIASAPALVVALQSMLDHYTALVNCGDCGSWDPEAEPKVKAARAALSKAGAP